MAIGAIKKICAVGAGAMGSLTALSFARAGYDVWLYDLTEDRVQQGIRNIQTALRTLEDHDILNAAESQDVIRKIQTTTELEKAAAEADWIIESVIEDLDAKQKIFSALDRICPPHTIFATNTSGLSPTAIAEPITRKAQFVVTHFWNPPHLVPLVEVVPGKHTSTETMEMAFELMQAIGKKPVMLKRECLGFVGNRLQAALLREALEIVQSGIATPEDVDTVTEYSLGRRLSVTGPMKSADLGGLDVFAYIFGYLGPDLCKDTGVPDLLRQAVASGNLGTKTGQGFYSWPAEKVAAIRQEREDMLIEHLIKDMA